MGPRRKSVSGKVKVAFGIATRQEGVGSLGEAYGGRLCSQLSASPVSFL